MPSNFVGFELRVDTGDGTVPVPSATVKVYDITAADPETGAGAVELDEILSDLSGMVASGTVDVDAGSTVRFSYTRAADGLCRCDSQVTT